MFLSQSAYGRYLLFSAAAGIFLGAVYDVFRILHLAAGRERSGAPHLIAVFLGDLLFAFFSAAAMILLTYAVNDGRFRWFAFVSAGIGFFAWQASAGRAVMKCADAVIRGVKAALRITKKIVSFLFAPLFAPVRRTAERIGKRAAKHKLPRGTRKRTRPIKRKDGTV